MRPRRQVRISAPLVLFACAVAAVPFVPVRALSAEENKKQAESPGAPKPTKADKADKAELSATAEQEPTASAASGLNAAQLLPIGVPSRNVRIPEFVEDVKVSQTIVAELTRISDDELDLTRMRMERYRPDGGLDHVVLIERGFYVISSGQLVSRTPTRIEARNMVLIGEGCDYSPDSPVVKILGRVTSFIDPNGLRPNPSEKGE